MGCTVLGERLREAKYEHSEELKPTSLSRSARRHVLSVQPTLRGHDQG